MGAGSRGKHPSAPPSWGMLGHRPLWSAVAAALGSRPSLMRTPLLAKPSLARILGATPEQARADGASVGGRGGPEARSGLGVLECVLMRVTWWVWAETRKPSK